MTKAKRQIRAKARAKTGNLTRMSVPRTVLNGRTPKDVRIPALTAAAMLLALGGCATCQNHPIACTVATALVVGSIAASLQQHDDQHRSAPSMSATQPTPCQANPAACT